MSILFIIAACAAVPLVFLTLFSKIERGIKLPLGSFFIIKNFASRVFRVLNLRDFLLLIPRLLCAVVLALLIIDPTDAKIPERVIITHQPAPDSPTKAAEGKGRAMLIIPPRVLDDFNEDLYFLEPMVKSLQMTGSGIGIMYGPDRGRLERSGGDIVVFPSPHQDRGAFDLWSDIFYLTEIQDDQSRIRGAGYAVKKYFRPVIVDKKKVTVYAELENDAPAAFAFPDNGRRVLVFSMGPSAFWGDAGLSGYFIDIISSFNKNLGIAEERITGDRDAVKKTGTVEEMVPRMSLLYAALAALVFESLAFLIRGIVMRRQHDAGVPQSASEAVKITTGIIFSIMLLTGGDLFADGFRFIELDYDAVPRPENSDMFANLKMEAEKRTSLIISPNFYTKITIGELAAGNLPELPYLWIIGCKGNAFYAGGVADALVRFVERGGIILFMGCAGEGDSLDQEVGNLALRIAAGIPDAVDFRKLPRDHPVYKSFYLLSGRGFSGVDISRSTRRTALLARGTDIKTGILQGDEMSIRAGINILLYLLSGNYKGDQIHTRQILKKLKERELYR